LQAEGGRLGYEYAGFVHTVLVDMRARLRKSRRPNRVFESVLEVAKAAGLVGRKRVLDSTALYDAVATQDTVTLVRSAIRALLDAADEELARQVRAVLKRDDDYEAPGKPRCDWDDARAREALVDALARDGQAVLECLQVWPGNCSRRRSQPRRRNRRQLRKSRCTAIRRMERPRLSSTSNRLVVSRM
jgi:hypothetical protein